MNRFLIIATLIAATLILNNCSAKRTANLGPLTPMPVDIIDPNDNILRAAIQNFLSAENAPAASTYDFRRIDLNNDRRRDALVILKSPYGHWCNAHGCTLLVMEASNEKFTPRGTVNPVRVPIWVSSSANNNWKDLNLRVSGRASPAKYVTLKFNGAHYPKNPEHIDETNNFIRQGKERFFQEKIIKAAP